MIALFSPRAAVVESHGSVEAGEINALDQFVGRSTIPPEAGHVGEITFLRTEEELGSFVTRVEEASLICQDAGLSAGALTCKKFCRRVNSSYLPKVLVHVKIPCVCAMAKRVAHVYDPIDFDGPVKQLLRTSIRHDATETMLRDWDLIFAGTSVMDAEIRRAGGRSLLLPHHHSNFYARRHSALTTEPTGEVTVGFAGKWTEYGTEDQLTQCLSQRSSSSISLKSFGKDLPPCRPLANTWHRGDCYATQLASFDIGIVWHQGETEEMSNRKSPQRLVNMLSVGIPVVAYAGYAGHHDVAAFGNNFMRFATTVDELCKSILDLVHNSSSLNTTEAVRVAEEYYSPSRIGNLYRGAFQTFLHS